MQLISLVIPIYNEEQNVELIYQAIIQVFKNLQDKYQYEIIFIDDGSQDQSSHEIKKIYQQDYKVKFLQLSRNFGKEIALTAGLHYTQGDAVIMIDADLQHPPELIPEFLQKWHDGADIVIGIRKKNKGEGWTKKIGSFFFYKIMNQIGRNKITPRATDYRLLDQKVVREFKKFTERDRMTRGLIDWLGFDKDYVYFTANERKFGKATYSFPKLIKLALSSFVTYSLFPLKLAGYLGTFIVITSGLLGLYIIIVQYIISPQSMVFSYVAQLAVLNIFLIGVVLSCLGLIALYVGCIHKEIMNRPLYILKDKQGFKE
ncbi:MAG: glycosyltransferase family 2 protein [Patescibacteria group bacterium]|nr:glycosyltransferase family 2 protein [Patescibacteria group bacterium]